jgi:hypothetical protein
MPARPVVADVVSVVVQGVQDETHRWVNKMYVRYSGAAPLVIDLDSYAAGLTAAWVANLTPLQVNTVQLQEVIVTDLASDSGSIGISSGSVAGTRAGSILPGDAAVLINYKLHRRYRGGHPRSYLVAGAQADLNTHSTWTSGFIAEVEAAWIAWEAALLVSYGTFVPSFQANVSYVAGGVPRLVPLVDIIDTTETVVEAELASQKRRIGRK